MSLQSSTTDFLIKRKEGHGNTQTYRENAMWWWSRGVGKRIFSWCSVSHPACGKKELMAEWMTIKAPGQNRVSLCPETPSLQETQTNINTHLYTIYISCTYTYLYTIHTHHIHTLIYNRYNTHTHNTHSHTTHTQYIYHTHLYTIHTPYIYTHLYITHTHT